MCSAKFRCWPALLFTAFLSTGASLLAAQSVPSRIAEEINSNSTVSLPGTLSPRIAPEYDTGRLDPATPIVGMTLWLMPTPEQQAELNALVKAQQTPGSPEYHQWLTPAQFADNFGLNPADIAKIENWLQSQGFNVDRVANSRLSITFSGTAGQVEAAFQTEMHHYLVNGETHFANSTNLSIPSALAGIVRGVGNLNDFRPQPQHRLQTQSALSATPNFTSAQSGAHFMTPDDVATIYDISPAYSAGYNGSGQTIAVVGQSAVNVSDIEAFQSAAGLTVKAPTMTLVPGTGSATTSAGDEAESDLDLEYSAGIATGATIDFVYVGNSSNDNVYNALEYAVQNKIGSIISISYGTCETDLSASDFSGLDDVLEQGASQGQSIIAASGDTGSTACYANLTKNVAPTAEEEALAVNFPASSAYVTALGGTEFPAADVADGNTQYWKSASGSDVISSALSYIPEQAWNDDSASVGTQYGAQYALSSGGGGVSTFATRPSWQTGVTGISSGSYRLVPDISLDASADNAGYLFCTSDTSAWSSGQKASCNDGFRDSSTQDLTVAGGTSFAAPIFAGMLAMINEKTNSSGQGVAAATLYSLASNAATYALAFHDITVSGNQCTAGPNYCSSAGASEYAAGTGYDEATGLGSVDLNNVLTAWTTSSSGGGGGTTSTGGFTLSASNISVAQGASGASTVTVDSPSTFAGAVSFSLSSTSTAVNTYGCYTINNATVAAGGTATTTLTVYTSESACSTSSSMRPGSLHRFAGATGSSSAQNHSPFGGAAPLAAFGVGGLLLLGFRRSRTRLWTLMGCLLLAGVLSFSTGCGHSSGTTTTTTTTTTSNEVPAGTYTLTLTGTSTADSSISATTTLTLTVTAS